MALNDEQVQELQVDVLKIIKEKMLMNNLVLKEAERNIN